MNPLDDVIAAIATPIGEGGIAVIRVSGKNAIEVAAQGFRGKPALGGLGSAQTHTAHFGTFLDAEGNVIDEVVATVFREPHSYTAENSVEISCHGGMFVTKKILSALLSFDARMAEPGEFTKRAFLNGRIDLSQAEAVADVIQAKSELSHRASLQQLQGILSQEIVVIRDKLLRLCGLMELELDFVEEGLEFTNRSKIITEISGVTSFLNELVDSFKYGKIYREGVKVVLAGKPNVGKSSILNSLLNENRAIVTEIPGTTRDVIEEAIAMDGVLFKLVDTAGLRESKDIVEEEGIRRTQSQIHDSDIVIFVVDVNDLDMKEDIVRFKQLKVSHDNFIIAINKTDLLNGKGNQELNGEFRNLHQVRISAKTGNGMEYLRKALLEVTLDGTDLSQERSLVITSRRHVDNLLKAIDNLKLARKGIEFRKSNEFIAVDLRSALDSLGEIIGVVTSDDILNDVFSKFCIGK